MATDGSRHRVLALSGAVLWMLALGAGSALAAQPERCDVQVGPRAAAGGSLFVFSGSGFMPTELTLQKEDAGPISHDINVGDADPWEITVRSRTGDEGTWTAAFTDQALDCTASVEFRVTLSNTDLIEDIAASTTSLPAPVLLYAVVVAFGLATGTLIGRRVRAKA